MSNKIGINVRTTVEVDVDEMVYLTNQEILEAINDNPSFLDDAGLSVLSRFQNGTILDSIKLQTISEILEKCTLEDLEKFKQTL